MTGSSWNFKLSSLSTLSLQHFINYSSGIPTPALVARGDFFLWVSAQVCCDFLYLPVSSFFSSGLLFVLTSLVDLRRVVDFSVSPAFYLCC